MDLQRASCVIEERTTSMQSATRDYWSIWKQFVLQGVMQEDLLPPSLVQSWRRCAAFGLDPYSSLEANGGPVPLYPASTSQSLLSLVRPAMEDLHQFVEGSECVVVFADAEARIVDWVGDRTMQQELEHLGLSLSLIHI